MVVVVLDQPDKIDDLRGLPAMGRPGTLLRSALLEVGLTASAVGITSAVRCRTPKDRVPTDEELAACSWWLAEELGYAEPVAIVLAGRVAQRSYALIKDELTFEHRVFHIDPPDKALRNKRIRDEWTDSLRRVAAYVRGEEDAAPGGILPWREAPVDPASPWLSVDTEGDSLEEDRAEHVVSWQLSDGVNAEMGVYTPWVPRKHVFIHNAKFDAPALNLDLEALDTWDDTALMAYVLREVPVGLKKLGPRLTGIEMGSIKPLLTREIPLIGKKGKPLMSKGVPRTRKEPRSFSEALAEEPEKAREYALKDAVVTARLAQILWPRLEAEPKLMRYYQEIEKPIVPIVAAMENYGVQIDLGVLGPLGRELDQLITQYEEMASLYLDAPEGWKINSPDQLSERLEQLGVKLYKETASGNKSVDKQALLGALDGMTLDEIEEMEVGPTLAQQGIANVLRYREYKKLFGTYVDKLPNMLDQHGRLHASFNQTVTDTDRFSSSDPNLQNIPGRTAVGKRIRTAFVAAPGYKLVRADASNLELRIYAHFTNDDVLRRVFETGGDAHSANAIRLFGSDKGDFRKRAKNGIFAKVYGASDDKFLATVGIPPVEGKPFLRRVEQEMGGILWWPRWIEQQLMEKGYVETAFGWRNYYPHYWSPLPNERAAAIREAGNMPIQGTASGLVKLFMIEQYKLAKQYDARIVLQVHDETVSEVPESAVEEYARKTWELGRELSQYLTVPIEVEIQVGDTWGSTKVVHFKE